MKISMKKNLIYFICIIFFYAAVQLLLNNGVLDSYDSLNIMLICINIMLAASLNLITGFTGQFSLGHAAFMSVGAYVSAIMTAKLGMPFAVAIIASAIAASLAGVLIGVPTLRLRGDYLAIATLGFGEIVRIIVSNTDYIGGASGFSDIPPYTNWTWIFFLTAAAIILIKNFVNSKSGRACIAIREDEIAAEAMGVNTTYYKVLAFTVGAFFAGIAGALYANLICYLKPGAFGFMKSIDILVIVVFGGLGSLTGSVLGAVVLSVISIFLQSFPELRMVIYSVILFLIMIYRPQGLMGTYELSLFKKGGKVNAAAKDK